jgi:hypothetical protein
MTEKIIVGDKEFISMLKRVTEDVYKDVHEEVVTIANEVRNTIILSMRNTPRNMNKAIARQFVRKTKTGKRVGKLFHYTSLPNNPPAIDSGKLVADIKIRTDITEIEVGDVSQEYGAILEEGSPKTNLEPRPWLHPAYANIPIEKRVFMALANSIVRRGAR